MQQAIARSGRAVEKHPHNSAIPHGNRRVVRQSAANRGDRRGQLRPVFTPLGVTHIVRRHSVRNRIERWIQELKRRINTFYASFTGNDVVTTNNWLRQFGWVWNVCLT